VKHPLIENVILSSVKYHDSALPTFLKKNFCFVELSDKTTLPIKNNYATPSTLGKDRLACAVASNLLYRNKPVLCVDAGTCIKYDFVNHRNEYWGGAIAPGLTMRLMALEHFTDKLPLVHYSPHAKLIGNTTRESILSGVVIAAAQEIKGMVALYRKKYPRLKIILTGGDVEFLRQIFNTRGNKNSSIFAQPNLILIGLNNILNHNI
jgi:type III pantothenate kinase